MKRASTLFLGVAGVAVAVFYFAGSGEDDPYAADRVRAESSARAAETKREETERRELEERIAAMPPGLAAPAAKEIASQLVASADNSTLDWRGQYGYIEDLDDGNGYTAGIIGFCSGTEDMLELVERYTEDHPGNALARYLPALREVDGSDSHEGLDPGFTTAWAEEAKKADFREAQESERDRVYFDPAVRQAKMDGLGTLGQFVYYDAMVLHGNGTGERAFHGIREEALKHADTPSEGGDEKKYLNAFLDARRTAMLAEPAHQDTTRIDTAQRVFVRDGNLGLKPPLVWQVYGESFRIP
ncbi:chitosanase [Streptomyces fructofermentans]|uniref:Chitosanase n=1 Tax=Streptomyces fructofermentans TaxID=152141 RepID=A0A918NMB0_9ACTN|nr:chitosanase [Streptomyces fructofermentans]GGX80413.1 chitosanase [Streptomyces fructofermentans]